MLNIWELYLMRQTMDVEAAIDKIVEETAAKRAALAQQLQSRLESTNIIPFPKIFTTLKYFKSIELLKIWDIQDNETAHGLDRPFIEFRFGFSSATIQRALDDVDILEVHSRKLISELSDSSVICELWESRQGLLYLTARKLKW